MFFRPGPNNAMLLSSGLTLLLASLYPVLWTHDAAMRHAETGFP
jgi:type II secretory pathway component PulM